MPNPWSNLTRAVALGLCLVFFGWFFSTIQPLLDPFIIAALLAYTLSPVVKVAQTRLRLSRLWAVSLVYFSSLALLITVPSVLTPIAVEQATNLWDDLVKIEGQLETTLAQPVFIAGQQLHLGQILANLLKVTNASLSPTAEGALAVLHTTSTSLVWLLIILIGVYYLLLNGEDLRDWCVRLAPEAVQPDIHRLLLEIDDIWQAYLRGTLLLMVIVGIVFSVVWMAIGLPGALVLGILAGLLTVIPDVGPTIVATLAVVVAFFKGSNVLSVSKISFAVLVFAIYFVLIQVKSIWLRPRIMGHFLHLNEGLVFVAIISATVLWGILGALIIIPLLATVGVIGRYLRCRILGLEPWPDDTLPEKTA